MNKLLVLVLAAFIGASLIAYPGDAEAYSCVKLINKANKILPKKKKLPAEKISEIKSLIAQAESYHNSDKHSQAQRLAEQALGLLGK